MRSLYLLTYLERFISIQLLSVSLFNLAIQCIAYSMHFQYSLKYSLIMNDLYFAVFANQFDDNVPNSLLPGQASFK